MKNDKCKILWNFTVQIDHEIYGRKPDVIVVKNSKNLCQIIDFVCPYDGKRWCQKIRKNRILPRFGKRGEKDMEHESQGYTTSSRWPRNNTHKVKTLVKGNRSIGTETHRTELQETVLLHTAQIFQKVVV